MSELKFEFIPSINETSKEEWNGLLKTNYPFLKHEYLFALEKSGAVSSKTGWSPYHLIVKKNESLVFGMPLYIKEHSYGEYVFDFQWAEAYRQNGVDYYPKLLNAIPFTPVPGPRVVFCNKNLELNDFQEIECRVIQECKNISVSGFHSLFRAEHFNSKDFLERNTVQYYWYNKGYRDFDSFLATCKMKSRKSIKRERALVRASEIEFKVYKNSQITDEIVEQYYLCYQLTYAKRSGHGGYLNREFFESVLKDMSSSAFLIVAEKDGRMIAGSLFFEDENSLYGRYWGCIEDVNCLHFELCYYQGIEYAIKKGLKKFDAGVQGEHKIKRGFEPTVNFSQHYIVNIQFKKAIAEFLKEESKYVLSSKKQLEARLPFKSNLTEEA